MAISNPVWMIDPDVTPGPAWVPADVDNDASMYHTGSWTPEGVWDKQTGPADICSKYYWVWCEQAGMGNPVLTITTTAIVNQWLQAHFIGPDIEWVIQHPGTYAANTLSLHIASNDHVLVTTSGLGNLLYQGTPQVPGEMEIPLSWGLEGQGPGGVPDFWCDTPQDFEVLLDMGDTHPETHERLFKIWQKLTVVKCNPVGTYYNEFTVTFAPKPAH